MWLGKLTTLDMTPWVDWAVKLQHKQIYGQILDYLKSVFSKMIQGNLLSLNLILSVWVCINNDYVVCGVITKILYVFADVATKTRTINLCYFASLC